MNAFKTINEIGNAVTPRKQPEQKGVERKSAPYYDEDKEAGEQKTEGLPPETTEPSKPQRPGLDPERARKSGKANAYIVSGGVEFMFSAVEMIRHSQSMSREEKEMLFTSRTKDKNKWSQKEKTINQKFLELTRKHEKVKESIKTKEEEMEILEYGFSLYAETTGKETNPNVIIFGALMRFVGTKAMDIFL